MYFRENSALTRERAPRPHMFAAGSRFTTRDFTLGPQVVGGSLVQEVSPAENLELLLCSIAGGVTPSTPGGGTLSRLWTFVPGATALDSMTVEENDGASVYEAHGVYGNRLRIAGNANAENLMTVDVFGKTLASGSLTGSLADRVPSFLEGWQSLVYIDAFGATPGTTVKSALLQSWDVTIDNNLARLYTADNANSPSSVSVGELRASVQLLVLASAGQAATEFANWDAATKRLVRLMFQGATVIEGSLYPYLAVDIAGAWSVFDLGQTYENVRAYRLTLESVYDPTNSFGVRVLAQSTRTAAW